MKTSIVLLRIAGSICFLFLLFHLAFYRMFHWDQTLSCLSQINRSILLTYHYICILFLAFMAIIALVQAKALVTSKLKFSVLNFFSFFFLLRIITEFTLFGSTGNSPIIVTMCAIPMVFFAYPMFVKTKNHE